MAQIVGPVVPGAGSATFFQQFQDTIQNAAVDSVSGTPTTVAEVTIIAPVGSMVLLQFEGEFSGENAGDVAGFLITEEDPVASPDVVLGSEERITMGMSGFGSVHHFTCIRIDKMENGTAKFRAKIRRSSGAGVIRLEAPPAELPGLTAYVFAPANPPPGRWVQLAKGTTVIDSNVETTVQGAVAIPSASVPLLLWLMRGIPTMDTNHSYERTNAATGVGNAAAAHVRNMTTGLVDFRIRHQDGAPRTFDWAIYQCTPA